jgi:SAM-dependent methyltransferase
VSRSDLANRVAALYDRRILRSYARWKIRTDPVYPAVLERLRGLDAPLIDVGCGVGLLPFFLREHGYVAPILGFDFDDRKIEAARRAAVRYRGIDFVNGDARNPLPQNHNVVILDVLQYCDSAAQQRILLNAREALPPGGVAILRQGVRDGSWRHRFSTAVDAAGRVMRWMKGERLSFPSRDEVMAPFEGFTAEVRPLWGRTPFNNYLFVFTRPR